MMFVLGVVIVRFNTGRGNHFAVGSVMDNIKPFLIHVDEYKSNFCSWDSLNTLPTQPTYFRPFSTPKYRGDTQVRQNPIFSYYKPF